MAKKRSRGREPQRRPVPRRTRPSDDHGPEQLELFGELRRALRADHPLAMLGLASSLLNATDPRNDGLGGPDPKAPSLGTLVESFIETRYAETTGVLLALRALSTDADLVGRISGELERRTHPMPVGLTGLEEVEVDGQPWFLTHVLGDGDDYLMGLRLPGGARLSALVYVDHNLGTVVKDAFVVPEPLEDLVIKMGTLIDEDQTLTRIDPALARAAVDDAIDTGAHMLPPPTSDDWPACRPLVEWMVRQLPAGGAAPGRTEWTQEQLDAVAAEFLSSPAGSATDGEDARGAVQDILWFATGYSTGDPFRWSPVSVEMFLDWMPRKVVADEGYLRAVPEVLRAFVRWAHDRDRIAETLTAETLAAVDAWEPDYLLAVAEGPQDSAALVAQLLATGGDEDLEAAVASIWRGRLEQEVGGAAALAALDDVPLPDEEFGWDGVPEDIRPVVGEMLELCDRCADELFDVEHRTAMRRFLARAATGDPAPFRRRSSPMRGAAAISWVITSANGSAGPSAPMQVQELMAWWGLRATPTQRAEPYLRANGVDPHAPRYGGVCLGAPDLLTSTQRGRILAQRDQRLGGR